MSVKPPARVVVAMSGGVDSSVAAALLREQGFDVTGLMLRLWADPDAEFENRCCASNAVALAGRVAGQLAIPFHVIDAQELFRQAVVAPMIAEYARGRTPNPCLLCNRSIRWGFLMEHALALGADYLATGHYARIREAGGGYELLRGSDQTKDQSYVLASLGQADLARTMFPLGGMPKTEVREHARRFELPVADRPDSQDLCFVPGSDYRRFLKKYSPESFTPGPILNRKGVKLGEHRGLPAYTIGQRKGIWVSSPRPLYALEIDTARNALIVGPVEELGRSGLRAEYASWVRGQPPAPAFRAAVKIRYTSIEQSAQVTVEGEGGVRALFDQPLRDITPGQSAVFYQEDICLGTAVIAEAME
ncbi:MAG: tRNA 2-thiouridine(34) synthase MnmA [Anaerolineales bacterium]|nr:tRNA 2-thiouridine(34) synthase MnmA [Anaerolineales bacterium]